jgi:hypothetical protein
MSGFFGECALPLSLVAACAGCTAPESPAVVPLARLASAEPAPSSVPSASASVDRIALPPVAWDCTAPPERAIDATPIPDVFVSPAPAATIPSGDARSFVVELKLPALGGDARAMIALDHHRARAAEPRGQLGSLLTEWDALAAGTHRLVVFWLDARGLPIQSSTGRALTSVRRFTIDAPAPLPVSDWLLVSPAGTLNGEVAPVGHPSGLSLIALGDTPAPPTLTVSWRGLARSGSLGARDCSLSFTESGDYHFDLRVGAEQFGRTVTVNRDVNPH